MAVAAGRLLLLLLCGGAAAEYAPPAAPPAGIDPAAARAAPPFVDGALVLRDGELRRWDGDATAVYSPVFDTVKGERIQIGVLANMDEEAALEALKAAERAWDGGQGEWPQMSLGERIRAIERVVASLKTRRAEIVDVLMWEIAKSAKDAAAEFDRTMEVRAHIPPRVAFPPSAFRLLPPPSAPLRPPSGLARRIGDRRRGRLAGAQPAANTAVLASVGRPPDAIPTTQRPATPQFIASTIETLHEMDAATSTWKVSAHASTRPCRGSASRPLLALPRPPQQRAGSHAIPPRAPGRLRRPRLRAPRGHRHHARPRPLQLPAQ